MTNTINVQLLETLLQLTTRKETSKGGGHGVGSVEKEYGRS